MLLSGFDEEIYENGLREEGREEGREEAINESFKILDLLSNGISPCEIATELHVDVSLVEKYQERLLQKI